MDDGSPSLVHIHCEFKRQLQSLHPVMSKECTVHFPSGIAYV